MPSYSHMYRSMKGYSNQMKNKTHTHTQRCTFVHSKLIIIMPFVTLGYKWLIIEMAKHVPRKKGHHMAQT